MLLVNDSCVVPRRHRRRHLHGSCARTAAGAPSALSALGRPRAAGLLLLRVQAEFLLGYNQLIDTDVNSFDDYKDQIAAITVKPVDDTPCASDAWCNELARAAAPSRALVDAGSVFKTTRKQDAHHVGLSVCRAVLRLSADSNADGPACLQASLHHAWARDRQRQLWCVDLPEQC